MTRLKIISISVVLIFCLFPATVPSYVWDSRFQPAVPTSEGIARLCHTWDARFQEYVTISGTGLTAAQIWAYGNRSLTLNPAVNLLPAARDTLIGESHDEVRLIFREGLYGKEDSIQVWNKDRTVFLRTEINYWTGTRQDSTRVITHNY